MSNGYVKVHKNYIQLDDIIIFFLPRHRHVQCKTEIRYAAETEPFHDLVGFWHICPAHGTIS